MDKIILRKQRSHSPSGWRPINVSQELWQQITDIAEELQMSKNMLCCILLEAALDNVEIQN